MGNAIFTNVNPAERTATQAQDLQSDAILTGVRFTIQVSLLFQRAQDVAGGTLWNLEFAADLGVAHAFGFLSDRLQHGECPFDRNRRRFVFERHFRRSPPIISANPLPNRYGSKTLGGQQNECMFCLLNNGLDRPSWPSYDPPVL